MHTDAMTDPATAVASASAALAQRLQAHLSPVLGRYYQTAWARGEGHRLYDADGRAYLDFACGIAVTVLGHGHPRVNAAIHAQVDRLMHVCNGLGYVEPVTALADALAATMPAPLDSVFFGSPSFASAFFASACWPPWDGRLLGAPVDSLTV